MAAVRFITTYCRKNGEKLIRIQQAVEECYEDNCEEQVIEMWLNGYISSNSSEAIANHN